MSGWVAKRFWKAASVVPVGGGWTVELDGRPVKTPAKARLVMPTRAMALASAAEWDAQSGEIKPATMPVTRAANSALDKIIPQQAEVVGLIAAYGASDLLCYRAEGPLELVRRQAAGWDPLLDWAAQSLGAPLICGRGIVPVDQPADSCETLYHQVAACTPFELAALHDLVAISGSLVLGLAVRHGRLSAAEAWDLSRIDETWQAELWGVDEEAAKSESQRRAGFEEAAAFHAMARAGG
jgi:chaperone required for assembly of F1-ATPase